MQRRNVCVSDAVGNIVWAASRVCHAQGDVKVHVCISALVKHAYENIDRDGWPNILEPDNAW